MMSIKDEPGFFVLVFNRTRLAGSDFIARWPDKSLECQLDCKYYIF